MKPACFWQHIWIANRGPNPVLTEPMVAGLAEHLPENLYLDEMAGLLWDESRVIVSPSTTYFKSSVYSTYLVV
jgi:hypothetical protein